MMNLSGRGRRSYFYFNPRHLIIIIIRVGRSWCLNAVGRRRRGDRRQLSLWRRCWGSSLVSPQPSFTFNLHVEEHGAHAVHVIKACPPNTPVVLVVAPPNSTIFPPNSAHLQVQIFPLIGADEPANRPLRLEITSERLSNGT